MMNLPFAYRHSLEHSLSQLPCPFPPSAAFGPAGCQQSDMKHHYRLYVTTFLGFGGNAIIRKYYQALTKSTMAARSSESSDSSNDSSLPGSINNPILDPCLSDDQDHVTEVTSLHGANVSNNLTNNNNDGSEEKTTHSIHFRGTGNFHACVDRLVPFLKSSASSSSSFSFSSSSSSCPFNPDAAICSVNGTFQPKVSSYNSEFYGFSEFYYSSYDILGMKGRYESKLFAEKAQEYCATSWNISLQRYR